MENNIRSTVKRIASVFLLVLIALSVTPAHVGGAEGEGTPKEPSPQPKALAKNGDQIKTTDRGAKGGERKRVPLPSALAEKGQRELDAWASRDSEYTKSAWEFLEAIAALPDGAIDLTKEKTAWKKAEEMLNLSVKHTELALKQGRVARDNYTKVALPASRDAERVLAEIKKQLAEAATAAKTDTKRASVTFWARFIDEAIGRVHTIMAVARDLDKLVEQELAYAEEDLESFRLGLQVIRVVQKPLQHGAELKEVHAIMVKIRERRRQTVEALKEMLKKLERSNFPLAPAPKVSGGGQNKTTALTSGLSANVSDPVLSLRAAAKKQKPAVVVVSSPEKIYALGVAAVDRRQWDLAEGYFNQLVGDQSISESLRYRAECGLAHIKLSRT